MKYSLTILFIITTTIVFGQQKYFVSNSGVDTPGNGAELNPYATLKYALSDITHVSGDTILVRAGTYSDVNINLTIDDIFIIGEGVNNTVFNGGGFFMNITGSDVYISDVTIKDYNDAGAIDIVSGSVSDSTYVTIEDCGFKDNISFSGFDANPEGGAIYIATGSGNLPAVVIMNNCQFNGNTAEDGLGGGAIYVEGQSRIELTNGRLLCNNDRLGLTTYDGGGIYLNNSSGSFTDCLFSGNKVFNQQGGAIFGATATGQKFINIEDCVFTGNAGREGVAVFINNNYDLNITNSLIVDNDLTTGFGNGGVVNSNGSNNNVSIINCTIANNNKVGGTGDCKGLSNSASNSFDVYNSIIWGNDDEDIQDFGAGSITVYNSVVDLTGGTAYVNGGSNSNSNPNFNGSADYSVQSGSVAIGRGNSGVEPSTDITSSVRTLLTSGAYEFGSTVTSLNLDCSKLLPVEYLYISSECMNSGIVLEWQTALEVNNDYFQVEKSDDGYAFTSVGRVTGNGNSSIINSYQFHDSEFSNGGASYYRLKQVDYNGVYNYSKIVVVNCKENTDFTVFPVPSNNNITIDLSRIEGLNLVGKIVDVTGEVVKEFSSVNDNKVTLSIKELSVGMYNLMMLNLETGEVVGMRKIIKN